jgi:hypothetical protein
MPGISITAVHCQRPGFMSTSAAVTDERALLDRNAVSRSDLSFIGIFRDSLLNRLVMPRKPSY